MTYANGTPSWVDLGSPEIDASVAFYGGLFGWTTTEPGPVEETGGYRMFLKDGKLVAGIGPNQEGQPPSWTTYLAVDDAGALPVEQAADRGALTRLAAGGGLHGCARVGSARIISHPLWVGGPWV